MLGQITLLMLLPHGMMQTPCSFSSRRHCSLAGTLLRLQAREAYATSPAQRPVMKFSGSPIPLGKGTVGKWEMAHIAVGHTVAPGGNVHRPPMCNTNAQHHDFTGQMGLHQSSLLLSTCTTISEPYLTLGIDVQEVMDGKSGLQMCSAWLVVMQLQSSRQLL